MEYEGSVHEGKEGKKGKVGRGVYPLSQIAGPGSYVNNISAISE